MTSASPSDEHPLPPEQRLHVEDLADKLLDKKERLAYFLITAMAFIVAFTFNDFNASEGVVRGAPLWLPGAGWGVLIASSLLPLDVIRMRHLLYTLNLRILESGRQRANAEEAKRFERVGRRIERAERLGGYVFVAGVGLIASAYVLGLWRSRPR
jgi:hypothetical protein